MAEKELMFDDLSEGQEFPASTFTMTPEVIRDYAGVVGDPNPLYTDPDAAREAGFSAPVAPPTTAALYTPLRASLQGVKLQPGTIHAKQHYRFANPAHPGDVLTTRVRIAEKFVKRERKYVVLATVTTNQRGDTVVEGHMTVIWPK